MSQGKQAKVTLGVVVGIVAVLGLSVLACVGVGVGLFMVNAPQSYGPGMSPSQSVVTAISPVDEPGGPGGPVVPEWVPDDRPPLDHVEHEEVHGEPLTVEGLLALSDLGVLEGLAYQAWVDYGEDVPGKVRPVALRAPAWHADGGIQLQVTSRRYVGVGGLTYFVSSTLFPMIAQGPPVAGCVASWAPDEWSFFSSECKRHTYDELVKLRFGKPLYKSLARLDPEAAKALTGALLGLDPDARVLGSDATVSEMYLWLTPAVPEYLAVHGALKKYGEKKALDRYRKALKVRGAGEPKGSQRDMVDFYYSFSEEIDLPTTSGHYGPTIVGFWLRRMDDGTAPLMLDFIKKAESRYAGR